MNKELKALLVFTTFGGIIFTFVHLFVNLYIWQQDKEISDLAWFNLSQFTIWMAAYILGTYLFQKTSLIGVMKASSIFSLILFVVLAFVKIENQHAWILFIGACFGFMRGFFSAGQTMSIALLGKGKEHTEFFQQRALYEKVTSIFTPLLFAGLLYLLGYRGTFIIMLILSGFMFLGSFFLPKLTIKEGTIFKKTGIKKVFNGKRTKYLPLSYLAGGVFSEFQVIFLTYFTFVISDEKLTVALLNIAYTLLTLYSIKLYKTYKKMSDEGWITFGILIAFVGFGLTPFLKGYWLFIPNILLVFGNFYYRTTYYAQQYQVMDGFSEVEKIRMLIWREVLLCFSRVTLLILVVSLGDMTGRNLFIVFLAVLLTSAMVPLIHRQFQLKKDA